MADHSKKWHDGTSTRNKSSNTFDGLASIQAQLNNLGREIKKGERGSGSLPSSTVTNPTDHVKLITTTEEAETPSIRRIGYDQYAVSSLKEDDKMPLIEFSRATVPFLGLLKEKGYDEKEVLMKLKRLQVDAVVVNVKVLQLHRHST
ncbi:hypothetical protein Tco_0734296 [Tanacetum coccineum]